MSTFARALETSRQYRFTLDDVLRMEEVGILEDASRLELIDGVLIQRVPEDAPHALMKMRIAKRFFALPDNATQMIISSTLRLEPTTALDPDFFLYDAALPLSTVTGANVGLVVEIAGATLKSDLTAKADLYAQHGVREYWVVDVNTDTVITHRTLAGGTYRDVVHHSARDTVSAQHLPGISLCLADLPQIR